MTRNSVESFIEDNIVYFREVGCPTPYAIAFAHRLSAGGTLRAIATRGLRAPRSHRILDTLRCILSLI